MTTTGPAPGPFAREHHVPEQVFGLVAAVSVVVADVAVMALWWWAQEGSDSPARTWLLGVLVATLVAVVLALMVRHPVARRTAVGALAVVVVLDAIVVGYELSGLR